MSNQVVNIYCDESCHLENDQIPIMVLGAVWCPKAISGKIARDIRTIKLKYGLSASFEAKWTKVSPAKVDFYCALIDYFFSQPDLKFRAVLISDKTKLNHEQYSQDHNLFYYKMFFYVLRNILEQDCYYHIYLDIKDSKGSEKLKELKQVLHNANYDFDRDSIQTMQHIRSHEVEQLQLTDLLIGALGYVHRGLTSNQAKLAVIERIRSHTTKSLLKNTLPQEKKFNLFIWEPRC